jgi:hypothetical protein
VGDPPGFGEERLAGPTRVIMRPYNERPTIMKLRITRDGVKTVSRFIVARATSITVVTLINQNVDPETRMQEAGVFIGAHVLGEMVADSTKPYVDRQIDEIADAFTNMQDEINRSR